MNQASMRTAIIGVAVLASTMIIAAAQQPNSTSPKVQPNLLPQEKAMHPSPSANAQGKTQKNSVAKGRSPWPPRSRSIFGKSRSRLVVEVR
jgi:hypothetical protein